MANARTEKPPAFRRAAWVAAVGAALVVTVPWGGVGRPARAGDKPEARVTLPADLALVPPDALFFVQARVADLWKNAAVQKLVAQLARDNPAAWRQLKTKLGVAPEELARVTLMMLSHQDREPLLILTTIKPFVRARLLEALVPDAREHRYQDRVYYTSRKGDRMAVYPVSDRVFLTGRVEDVVQTLVRLVRPRPARPLLPGLRLAAEAHHIVAALQVPEEIRTQLKTDVGRVPRGDPLYRGIVQTLGPLLETRSLALTVDGGKETTATLRLQFADEAAAKKASWPTRDALVLLRILMKPVQAEMAGLKELASLLPLLNQLEKALRTAPVTQTGPVLQVAVRMPGNLESLVATSHAAVRAVFRVRQAARRAQSANNLKQIALALHNYHETFKTLPPPAIYGKNGKPLLSWRVAILPFVEQDQLYKQFKLDEPWDSDHNKKLLAQLPPVYAPVGVKTRIASATFYQAFVGEGAAFEARRGMRFGDFADGTSNTIWIAEAAEAVPWTKPEDLVFDAKKDPPRLGGLFPDGFHVAFADASVRFIKRTIDKATLRALITRNGGEVIDLSKLD